MRTQTGTGVWRLHDEEQTGRTAAMAALLAALTLVACGEAPPPTPSSSAPGTSPAFVAAPNAGAVASRMPDAGVPGFPETAAGAHPPPTAADDARAASAPPARLVLPALDFPPGPLYFCEADGERIAIEYEPRVYDLCRRHPEMSPCQYERNACRKRGGRVFTARAEEVTPAVEAEYDRTVRRVTLRGDGSAPR
jgi:hypothetical protein